MIIIQTLAFNNSLHSNDSIGMTFILWRYREVRIFIFRHLKQTHCTAWIYSGTFLYLYENTLGTSIKNVRTKSRKKDHPPSLSAKCAH